MVFVKVSPMTGIMRFRFRGKLTPKYMGPYDIVQKIGPVAYRLALPTNMVHDIFLVSQLRKYIRDQRHVLETSVPVIEPDLTYEERPISILDRKVKLLRSKMVPLVKVLWRCARFEEQTWETEASIRASPVRLGDRDDDREANLYYIDEDSSI